MSVQYRDAGVNLDTATDISRRISSRLGSVLFGGFLPVSALKSYRDPFLVTSIDGAGTKVRLASRLGDLSGLGTDIVHHCVNDIAVHGATPLCFLDYLAFSHLDAEVVETIVNSIATSCERLGFELVGGETAEMPLVYPSGSLDIAGAIVGAVERDATIDGSAIRQGDTLFGLPSSGLHTNGFSLIQRIFDDDDYSTFVPALGETLGLALLTPHRCYLAEIRTLVQGGGVHGLAHITGGGIAGNLARLIPEGLQASVRIPDPPPLFGEIAAKGVSPSEIVRVFNAGIGLIAVCDSLISRPEPPFIELGTIEPSSDKQRRVVLHGYC